MNKSVLWKQVQMVLDNLSAIVTSIGNKVAGAEKKITDVGKKVDAIPKLNLVNGNAEGAVRSVTAKEETSDYQLGENAIAIGGQSEASGENSVAIGDSAKATELWSYALGFAVKATAKRSHAEGELTVASGDTSHAEGSSSVANGSQSHAEGNQTRAEGKYSHAEGYGGTDLIQLTGDANATTYKTNYHSSIRPGKLVKYGDAVAEVTASTGASITLNKTLSSTALSGAWGTLYYGAAVGDASHSEGRETYAIGAASHAEGNSTMAIGRQSHAEGYDTIAAGRYQHAQGKYNIADDNDRYAHIVGNGGGNGSRSNAHTLDWDGNAWFKGKVFVGGNSMDDGAVELGAGGGGAEVRQLSITQDMDALVYFDTGEMTDSQTAIDILSKRPTLRVRGNNGEDLGGLVVPAMIERDEDTKMVVVMLLQPGYNGGVQSVALPLKCSDSVV